MQHNLTLTLFPEIALDDDAFRQYINKKLNLRSTDQPFIRKTRQSIDARSRQVKVNVQAEVYVNEQPPSLIETLWNILTLVTGQKL
jgi:hypothetical protein